MPGPATARGARRSRTLAHWVRASAPPGSGSVVMATGVISIALQFTGWDTLSQVLFVLTGACWLALAWLFVVRFATDPVRARHDAHDVSGLTSVAATGILGTRLELAGWSTAALVFWGIAVAMLLALMPLAPRGWPKETTGSHFLVTVAAQGVAILAAVLAARHGLAWPVPIAFALLCLGLVLYAVVLVRFRPGELLTGLGDQWIAGGGLVISALAAAALVEAVRSTGELGVLQDTLEALDLALWSLSMVWLVVLTASEVMRPRLAYHAARWATVFPLGMYAAMSWLTGEVESVPVFRELARWLVWVAFAVWCLTALGLVRRARWLLDGREGIAPGTSPAQVPRT